MLLSLKHVVVIPAVVVALVAVVVCVKLASVAGGQVKRIIGDCDQEKKFFDVFVATRCC
jgi:hypothetical protein